MESMGQSRTSEVQRDARIGEAECNRQVFDDDNDLWIDHDRHDHGYEHHSDHQDHHHLDDNSEDKDKMPRDCLIETALAEETRLEAKLLNDTEIELYKVFVLFVGFCFFLFGTHCR